MRTRRLGSSDLDVTVVGLGCNNFGGRIDEAGDARGHRRGARRGHHVLRHRRQLRQRAAARSSSAARSPGGATRSCSRRSSGTTCGDGETAPRLARLHPQGDRGLAAAAADRPDRPLPVPPPRRRDPDRGDARRAPRARRRRARCARSAPPTSRRRWSRRPDAIAAERGLTPFVSAQSEYSWLAPRRGGRADAGLRAARGRLHPVLPARERPAHREVPARRAGAGRDAAARPRDRRRRSSTASSGWRRSRASAA